LGASNRHDQVSRNVELRDLERVSDRVTYTQVDTSEHLKNIVLPEEDAPVRLAAKCHDVALVILRAKGNTEELFGFEVVFGQLSQRDHLLSFAGLQVENGELGFNFAAFTNGEEFLGWRNRYEIYRFNVLASRDEVLGGLLWIKNDHIVTSDIKQLFLIDNVEIVANLSIDTEDELWCKRYTLQAKAS
jgi:hypothetical protein